MANPKNARELILRTTLELLSTKELSEITVTSIIRSAGINRNSFYYHYQDKFGPIEELVDKAAGLFAGIYSQDSPMETIIRETHRITKEHEGLFVTIFSHDTRLWFRERMWEAYGSSLVRKTAELVPHGLDPKVIARCKFEAFNVIFEHWVLGGFVEDDEYMVAIAMYLFDSRFDPEKTGGDASADS